MPNNKDPEISLSAATTNWDDDEKNVLAKRLNKWLEYTKIVFSNKAPSWARRQIRDVIGPNYIDGLLDGATGMYRGEPIPPFCFTAMHNFLKDWNNKDPGWETRDLTVQVESSNGGTDPKKQRLRAIKPEAVGGNVSEEKFRTLIEKANEMQINVAYLRATYGKTPAALPNSNPDSGHFDYAKDALITFCQTPTGGPGIYLARSITALVGKLERFSEALKDKMKTFSDEGLAPNANPPISNEQMIYQQYVAICAFKDELAAAMTKTKKRR